MSKISCHIIQDILPLYVDGIVSEDTKEMVEEHLWECESCRKEAEHMQERIVLPNKKEFYQKEQEMLQKFKRRLINRRVLSAILGAVFVCALLASGYTILMIPKEAIPFDPDKVKVRLWEKTHIYRIRATIWQGRFLHIRSKSGMETGKKKWRGCIWKRICGLLIYSRIYRESKKR